MKKTKIAIIGLGYVGLPLARLFSTKYPTVGFDLNAERIKMLMSGHDDTLELEDHLLQQALKNGLFCTNNINDLHDCNVFVVAVPTPVDKNNHPDLTPLQKASETVGKIISKGDIVIYESTVYPGVTEDVCLPIVEKISGLTFNKDFFKRLSLFFMFGNFFSISFCISIIFISLENFRKLKLQTSYKRYW